MRVNPILCKLLAGELKLKPLLQYEISLSLKQNENFKIEPQIVAEKSSSLKKPAKKEHLRQNRLNNLYTVNTERIYILSL